MSNFFHTGLGTPSPAATKCATCKVRDLCMPPGLGTDLLDLIDEELVTRRKVKKGDFLMHRGENFNNLYVIRTGFFKTRVVTEDGREQVTGFQMAGDYLGLNGIAESKHNCDAIALEDSDICVLPFDRVEEVSRNVKALQRHIHKVMSQEIVREGDLMLMLGGMRADERIAVFLLNLTHRLFARGYSKSELILRMTRQDMGSFLCIKLETVSRMFSRFAAIGLLEVKNRHIHILDVDALLGIVNDAPNSLLDISHHGCKQAARSRVSTPSGQCQPSGKPMHAAPWKTGQYC